MARYMGAGNHDTVWAVRQTTTFTPGHQDAATYPHANANPKYILADCMPQADGTCVHITYTNGPYNKAAPAKQAVKKFNKRWNGTNSRGKSYAVDAGGAYIQPYVEVAQYSFTEVAEVVSGVVFWGYTAESLVEALTA